MAFSMFLRRDALQVLDVVVGGVAVCVMDDVPVWNLAVVVSPDLPVEGFDTVLDVFSAGAVVVSVWPILGFWVAPEGDSLEFDFLDFWHRTPVRGVGVSKSAYRSENRGLKPSVVWTGWFAVAVRVLPLLKIAVTTSTSSAVFPAASTGW
jgi:hypothetical protein